MGVRRRVAKEGGRGPGRDWREGTKVMNAKEYVQWKQKDILS